VDKRKRRAEETLPIPERPEKRAAAPKLFCVCQQPYDTTAEYIGCDGCENWFHFKCVGLEKREGEPIEAPYFCPQCKQIRHFCVEDDTPTAIANALSVAVADLVTLNQKLGHPTLTATSKLMAGTALVVPGRDAEYDRLLRHSEPKPKKSSAKRPLKKKKTTSTSSADKTFLCELCTKAFGTMYHLNRHLKVHAKREAEDMSPGPDGNGAAYDCNALDDGDPAVRKVVMLLITRMMMNHRVAGPFCEPVTEDIAPEYFSVVHRPMDLGTVMEHVRGDYYTTIEAFRRDVRLIETNCVLYNDEQSEISAAAHELLVEFEQCCEDFGLTTLSLPVQGGTAHALLGVVRQISSAEGASIFATPVNPDDVPGYADVVKEPMDLSTVVARIQGGEYADVREILCDLQKIWSNCRAFYGPDAPIVTTASKVEAKCAEELRRWARSWKLK
jgi:hypothetical protein